MAGGKYVIRTSDRISFKSCRQAWDYGSKLRQNYEPISLPKPLDFGTAIHSGLEAWYRPETWDWDREVVATFALQTFRTTNRQALLRYEELRGSDELVRIDFAERDELGVGMLTNYFAWSPSNDKFRPAMVEIEFEVPIPVPGDLAERINCYELDTMTVQFKAHEVESGVFELYCRKGEVEEWWPVVYQGRIDLIIQDDFGRYWIWDHKTCAQMRADVIAFLMRDEQMKSYGWAIQKQLGVEIAGIIYSELYKGVPSPPNQNKTPRQGRWFSVNKQQDTTYELYLATIQEKDAVAYEQGLYDDMLEYLKAEGNKYFRRTPQPYTQREYEILGDNICLEAIDMLSDPMIYPNPSRFKCNYCMFGDPCLSRMEGSDEAFVLEQLYVQREQRQTDSPFTENPQEEPA